MATVQTVPGPVEAVRLGRVLMHEHLLCLLPGPWPYGGPRGPEAFDEGPPGHLVPNDVQFPGRPVWGALG